jgi:enamine deaminase RidA (YjgF/YER057c/UK114 family)
MDVERFGQGRWMSETVACAGLIYLSGAIASNPSGDIGEQTSDVLGQIDSRLLFAGSGRDNLVFVNIWLADRADFAAMNAIWEQWIGDAPRPARATVEAGLMLPDLKVEIAVVAARK